MNGRMLPSERRSIPSKVPISFNPFFNFFFNFRGNIFFSGCQNHVVAVGIVHIPVFEAAVVEHVFVHRHFGPGDFFQFIIKYFFG
jgi:hypothetical protein